MAEWAVGLPALLSDGYATRFAKAFTREPCDFVFREIRLRKNRVAIGSLDRRGPICRDAKESHDDENDSGTV